MRTLSFARAAVLFLHGAAPDALRRPEALVRLRLTVVACGPSCAQKYYEKALDVFTNKFYTSRITWLIYGDINQKRIDFVQARIDTLNKVCAPMRSSRT